MKTFNQLKRYFLKRSSLQNNKRSYMSAWQRVWSVITVLALTLALVPGTPALAVVSPSTGIKVASIGRAAPHANRVAADIAAAAAALPVLPASTQFDITGFLQSATLDAACVAAAGANLDAQGFPQAAHCGGTMMLNGHTIIVPAETVVILPASALTWQELFAQSPAPYTGVATGMALNDLPKPLTTYEFQAVGNRVGNTYIAGLVHATQQDLNSGAGYINFMDYNTGEMEVGGVLGVQGTGARVQINDPVAAGTFIPNTGRYTRGTISPDGRFQVDPDNPTIASASGFPMCFPRTDPAVADDPLCPQANRPISTGVVDLLGQHAPAGEFDQLFRMNAPGAGFPDPTIQAPFEVGDFVNFAGTLIQDGGANGGYYISAHTIVNNVAIFTQPGIDPAYVTIEVGLIGTGGLTVFGAGEAAIRTRFEGMTTDETRQIHLYGIDVNPVTGVTSDRDWGTILPDPGPPNGAVRGRWRFRPPCVVAIATDKKCTPPVGGSFLPPTREVRAVIEGLQQFLPGTHTANPASQVPGTPSAVATANGIFYGQYHAPIGEFIFPENIPGNPMVENNFNTIDFLAFGGYSSFTGVLAGVLNPWPSSVNPPARVCAVPTIIGGPYSVANGGSINLSGSVNPDATSPVAVSWTAGTAPGGTNLNGALTNANTTTPTFNATGLAAATYFLTFTASNVCGAASATTTITVQPAPPPTINPIPAQTVNTGTLVTMNASSASLPAPTFNWVQVANGAPIVALNTAALADGSRATFTPAVAGTYLFDVTATNANGTSPATRVTITVNAATATILTITVAEYRISKQRLILSVTAPVDVTAMTLQPYKLDNGTTYNPAGGTSLVNNGGGLWTITVVGASPPACNNNPANYATPCSQKPLIVTSTGGAAGPGTSVFTALTKIRQ